MPRELPPKTLPKATFQTPGESLQIKTPLAWARDLQLLIRLIDQTEDPSRTIKSLCEFIQNVTPTTTPKSGLKSYLRWRQLNSRS